MSIDLARLSASAAADLLLTSTAAEEISMSSRPFRELREKKINGDMNESIVEVILEWEKYKVKKQRYWMSKQTTLFSSQMIPGMHSPIEQKLHASEHNGYAR